MIYRIIKNGKQFLVTLRFSILTIFITLFVLMVALIILVTSSIFSTEMIYMATRVMNYASKNVFHQITDGLIPAERDSRFSAYLFTSGTLKPTQETIVPYMTFLVKNYPLAIRAYWADAAGDFISSEKQPDGTITSHIVDRSHVPATETVIYRNLAANVVKTVSSNQPTIDVRELRVFQEAEKNSSFFWGSIHFFRTLPIMGVAAITPIHQNGKFVSMFSIDISLDYLSRFVTEQKISRHGFVFIVTEDGDLVAYPKRSPFTEVKMTPNQLTNVHKVGLPIISVSLDQYKKTGKKILFVTYAGKKYVVRYLPSPNFEKDKCLIGAIAPVTDFTKFLSRLNLINLLMTLALLVIGIFLVSKLVTRVVQPIKTLVKEADRIKHFDLDNHIYFLSRIKEVVLLRDAFESMRLGLRQFQRYVPKMLVRQLIESGNDTNVGGVRKELVIFFSDVKNFTTIAEKMDPNQLMFQVCDYFEALTKIIIDDNKGTLDKYIGDAVMAFWGAPLPERHPCYLAARAALQCHRTVMALNTEWQQNNKPMFETYFAIHMGVAVVGNVGSSERLNYTALGDSINIASRLEDINRVYGTHILVSDVVYEHIKHDFALRLVDQVIVRGRLEPIYIYELLGENESALSFDLAAYRQSFMLGFQAYQAKKWREARDHFEQCLVVYPADTLAPIFITRCNQGG